MLSGLRQLSLSEKIFLIVSGILFCLLFSWQLRVGMTRFFDVDEFTYFHWVSQFAQGERPYIDFFMFFPPLFLFIIAPVFWLIGNQVAVFLVGRVVAVGIAGLLFLTLSLLFGITRKQRAYLLLPAIIAAFLPMPFDKFIEIRPDNLATLSALIGVVFHSLFLMNRQSKKAAFFTGFFYAASLLVFPKAISFVFIGVVIWILDVLLDLHGGVTTPVTHFHLLKKKMVQLPHWWVVIGGASISILVGLYLLLLGNVSQVFYSLTKLALETNKTYGYVMEPHLFFFPNAAFYGGNGITSGLFFNHFFWILGIFIGVYRLYSCGILSDGNKRIMLRELLLSGVFFFNVWLYISFYPMKHPQYLIPVALFVAFYAADGIALLFTYISRFFRFLPLILFGFIAVILIITSKQVNEPKLFGHNRFQLEQLTQLKNMIPTSTEVFDIEGRMVFWKQPYPICCLPFGEYMYNVSRKPSALRDVLEQKKVLYLWQGESRRIYTLEMSDRIYIQNNYKPVDDWGDTLWKRIQE